MGDVDVERGCRMRSPVARIRLVRSRRMEPIQRSAKAFILGPAVR